MLYFYYFLLIYEQNNKLNIIENTVEGIMLFWQTKEEGVESSILKMCHFTPYCSDYQRCVITIIP